MWQSGFLHWFEYFKTKCSKIQNFDFFAKFSKYQFWAPKKTLLIQKKVFFLSVTFLFHLFWALLAQLLSNRTHRLRVIKFLKIDPFIHIFAVSMATVGQKKFFFCKILFFFNGYPKHTLLVALKSISKKIKISVAHPLKSWNLPVYQSNRYYTVKD